MISPFDCETGYAFETATGSDLDKWGHFNGARLRNPEEPDAVYREIIRIACGCWAMIHPAFGQSVANEGMAILQNKMSLADREKKFRAITKTCLLP